MQKKQDFTNLIKSGLLIAAFAVFAGVCIGWMEFRSTGRLPELFLQEEVVPVDVSLHYGAEYQSSTSHGFEVLVGINPHGNAVTGTDISIEFDPTYLHFEQIESIGTAFDLVSFPLESLGEHQVLKASALVPVGKPGFTQETKIMRLVFSWVQEGETILPLDAVVAIAGYDSNAVGQTRGLQLPIDSTIGLVVK